MNRYRYIGLIFILLFVLVSGLTNPCRAGDRNWLAVNVGKTFANSEFTDFASTGHTANYAFDRNLGDGPFAVGLNLTFINQREDFRRQRAPVELAITASPLYLQGRAAHEFTKVSTAAYVGAGVGVCQNIRTFNKIGAPHNKEEETKWGAAANVTIGGMIFATGTIYIDALYQLHWLDNSFFDHGLAHTLVAGVGFRFGN